MNIGDFAPDYRVFYDFLLANDALTAFLENANDSVIVTSDAINECLHWSATPQERDYWYDLSNARPSVRISGTLFKQYCELLEASLSQPYEYW